MNPRILVNQTTGRCDAGQIMRAAHGRARFLASKGHNYRAAFATALRDFWSLAQSEAHCWKLERSTASGPVMYTGGRVADGVANEMWG